MSCLWRVRVVVVSFLPSRDDGRVDFSLTWTATQAVIEPSGGGWASHLHTRRRTPRRDCCGSDVGDGAGVRDRSVLGRFDRAGHPAARARAIMTATKDRLFFIWVTAHYPRVDHAVSDAEIAARDAASRGEYRALCGAVFLPAPDTRPPGQLCPACSRFLRARATLPATEQRLDCPRGHRGRHARAGWWTRLWCGNEGPSDGRG